MSRVSIVVSSLLMTNLLHSATVTVTGDDLAGAVASATSGDTITINGTITATEVNISGKNLTFQGANHQTDIIQAQADVTVNPNTSYIFSVVDSNVTFSNITIKNATQNTDDGNGSAIGAYNSRITIIDSNLSHNSGARGGAIYLYDADLNISNSILSENNTTILELEYDGNNKISGGVIFIHGLEGGYNNSNFNIGRYNYITIANSQLYNNSSQVKGGVLFNDSARDTYIKVSDSNFTNNKTFHVGDGKAAVFYLKPNKGFIDTNITNSKFELNIGSNDGGVMFIHDSDSYSSLYVGGSTFIKNATKYGGGVFDLNMRGNLKYIFENSSFTESNSSDNDGGVMRVRTKGAGHQKLLINDCNFTDNRVLSGSSGGALYLKANAEGSMDVEINRVVATGNNGGKGGVIYLESYDGAVKTVINDSNFTKNYSTHTSEGGGVFYIRPDDSDVPLIVNNSHFEENNATKHGGVIFFVSEDSEGIFVANDSTFIRNYAIDRGGVAYLASGGYRPFSRAIFKNSLLKDNNATYGGAISIWDNGENTKYHTELFESTMTGNRASYGGAIYADIGDNPSQRTIIDIYNSKIVNNQTTISGAGGLHINKKSQNSISGQGLITIKNSVIANNSTISGANDCHNDFNTSMDNFFNSLGGNVFGNLSECHGANSDKTLIDSGYNTTDLETLEIMGVAKSKWNMKSIKNGYSANSADIKNGDGTVLTDIYNFSGSNWTPTPSNITPKTGLWIFGNSDTIWVKGSSDRTNDIKNKTEQLAYYKGLSSDSWHLVAVKHPMKWSDFTRDNITPNSCSGYTKIFYLNSIDNSWNSVDEIPSNSAMWLKHYCN